jgi:putative RecB family exonuclease
VTTFSYSQYSQYKRCAYSWYLARRLKVWRRPAAWLPQGTAVHEAAEEYEKSGRDMALDDVRSVFCDAYTREVEKYTEDTPNFEYWFRSGPYGGADDVERRLGIGLGQVNKYVDWYDRHPEEVIWIAPDGTPGIELGFDIDLDRIQIRGYIDAVIQTDSGMAGDSDDGSPRPTLVVRDNKTGNKPGDDFQLALYAVALQEQFGVFVDTGDYWMGRTGKPTVFYDLSGWTRERVAQEFRELRENIEAERFEPDPEPSKCMFCDVASSCAFRAQ